MTYKKKPLRAVKGAGYPKRKAVQSNRRQFLATMGKLGVVSATGLIASACDHVMDANPDDSGVLKPDDTGQDTGYLAGDIEAPTDSDSGRSTDMVVDTDSGYLGGDIAPDTETAVDTGTGVGTDMVVDTDSGYLAGDIAPDTETVVDTGDLPGVDGPTDTDTETGQLVEIDTGYLAGGLEAPPDTDTALLKKK